MPTATKTEADLIKDWTWRFTDFLTWRDKTINKAQNQQFWNYYRAQYYQKTSKNKTGVPLVFTYVDVIMSALDQAFPILEATPRQEDNRTFEGANAMEAVLNYEQRETNWRQEMRKALFYALLQDYGGWIKVGWYSEFGLTPAERTEASAEAPPGTKDGHVEGKEKGEIVEYDEFIKAEHPWVKHIDGRKVFFDRHGSEITDASWMAFEYDRSIADLVDDKATQSEVAKQLENDGSPSGGIPRDDQRITCREIWDKKTGMVYVWTDKITEQWVQDPKPWPLQVEGFPVAHLKFFENEGTSLYGMAAIRAWSAQNEEVNKYASDDLETSNRFVPKYQAERDTFTGNGLSVFEGNVPGSLVLMNPGKVLRLIEMPAVRMDRRLATQAAMDRWRFASGVSEQQAGVQSELTRTTATEVQSRDKFSGSRFNNLGGLYDELWNTVARKVALIVKQCYPPSKVIPVYDPGTNRIVDWTRFDKEWREAEYDIVCIRPGSTRPPSKEMRRQAALQTGNMMAQLLAAAANAEGIWRQSGKVFNSDKLIEAVLRPFDSEITRADWQEILPPSASQNPGEENLRLIQDGEVFVIEEDDDRMHLRTHVPLFALYQRGDYGQPDPAVVERWAIHIREHQAAQMVENPQTEGVMQAAQQVGGMQGGPPIGPGEGPTEDTQAAQGMMTPGAMGGMANAASGQAINRGGQM